MKEMRLRRRKVSAEQLRAALPAVDPALIDEHLARLDARYFERFDPPEITSHISDLAELTAEHPVRVRLADAPAAGQEAGDIVRCTVLAFDQPGVFSLITGVLSSAGFNIRSGDIFTWSPSRLAGERRETAGPRAALLRRRRIIDRFTGTIASVDRDEGWGARLADRMREVCVLLEQGGEHADQARRLVNTMAAGRLAGQGLPSRSVLYPVSIDVDPSATSCTRMRVISEDTPFFLFTFSTALSLQNVSIEQVTIRTRGTRIEDEFEFVDAGGRGIDDPRRIDRIRLSVLLTKQFTSFLGGAPDPLSALLRFESLVRDLLALPEQGDGSSSCPTRRCSQTWLSCSGRARSCGRTSCACSTRSCCPCSRPP